ncbi:hypothetical protein D9611_007681 [Ephemerocybe angulata]|uniref:Uncharacterized protein n=1 Tax=Ephemerocybe angulata TaxID=980116 RepID=A0A8H5BXS5_9AGAR|nr:hypothetical protein D9611_007681 [Tulosesus angulatus]
MFETMDGPTKRFLTEEDRGAADALDASSHSSIPSDIALQLRNVGSRVRRSVSQGYITTPHSFTKHNSTGALWRSESDTLRDVFSNPMPVNTNAGPPMNKRDRTMVDDAAEDAIDLDATRPLDHVSMDLERSQFNAHGVRPMKPLRKNRKAVSDSVLTFGGGSLSRPKDMATTFEVDEEDWSVMQADNADTATTPFQPLEF